MYFTTTSFSVIPAKNLLCNKQKKKVLTASHMQDKTPIRSHSRTQYYAAPHNALTQDNTELQQRLHQKYANSPYHTGTTVFSPKS